ncbi:hypothetical protein [Rhodococcus opacus]|uniref:hypothetical protein n=1 Tax=Rhodococcus opacus TaxID=37919 RepID=UPI0012FDA1C7|nr:hypothetical protein [Rhodococcus opacus]
MAAGSAVKKVVLPTAVVAAASTGVSIAVSMATGGQRSAWLWAAVAGLTVVSFLGSLWLYRRQTTAPAVSGSHSVSVGDVGGNIDIRADKGSAAALQMGNVTIGNESKVDPPVPGGQSN